MSALRLPEPVANPLHPDISLVNMITENWDGARWLPTGALYLISSLESAGYQVEFLDYQMSAEPDKYHPEEIARYLARAQSDVLGIGLMIDMLPATLRAVEILRARRPDLKVVLGGPGPSNLTDQILSRYPGVDVICRGEGEATIVELMAALHGDGDLSKVSGIAYKDGDGSIRTNPVRARTKVLSELPQPAYHRVDFKDYYDFGVLFSRGCVFTCEFCEIPWIWQHQVQRRPIDDIVDELILLRDRYGRRRVEILDDLFVAKRSWTEAFCRRMIERKVDVEWSCFGYISLMTEDLMALMKEAGCAGIFYGIESGSDRILERVDKKFTIAEARKTVLTTLKYIKPVSSFIWNYPYESLQEFYDTFSEFVYLAHRGSKVCLFMLAPLHPTPFARDFKGQMQFDEGLWCGLLKRSRYAHVTDLIRSDPETFGAFYHFASEGLATKIKLVENTVRERT